MSTYKRYQENLARGYDRETSLLSARVDITLPTTLDQSAESLDDVQVAWDCVNLAALNREVDPHWTRLQAQ